MADGRGAQTVYRNREGKRIEREEWVELQQKKKKKRVADYPEQDGAEGMGGALGLVFAVAGLSAEKLVLP